MIFWTHDSLWLLFRAVYRYALGKSCRTGYYTMDTPEISGYAMRKGYYNPLDTSEFVEKDSDTLCDWM